MPSLRATASAVVRLSPVSMTMRTPSARSALERRRRRRLDRVGDRDQARRAGRRRARNIAVAPSRRSSSACASERRRWRRRARAIMRGVAERHLPAVHRAAHALAGDRGEAGRPLAARAPRSSAARDDRRGQRVLARRARGWPPSAQHRRFVAGRRRRPPRHASACPRSACRSCRPPACRPSPAAPAPRRSGSARPARRRGRRRP